MQPSDVWLCFLLFTALCYWTIVEQWMVVNISNGWQAGGERGEQIGQVEAMVWSERSKCCKGDCRSWITSYRRERLCTWSSRYTGIALLMVQERQQLILQFSLFFFVLLAYYFTYLTLLVGRQERHPACKKQFQLWPPLPSSLEPIKLANPGSPRKMAFKMERI